LGYWLGGWQKIIHPSTIPRKDDVILNTRTTRPTQSRVAGVEFHGS
jgi:hypothetical protein